MPDYQKMYSVLFNGITDVIERLQRIQIKAEELYMDSGETPLNIIEGIGTDKSDSEESSIDVSLDAHNYSDKA